jgi:hypothetical protein
LALPHSWARRLFAIADMHELQQTLRELADELCNVLAQPPDVTDVNWLERAESGDVSVKAKSEDVARPVRATKARKERRRARRAETYRKAKAKRATEVAR